jgi:ribosome-binding protein aMBF1 (putative translation factor)
MARKKAITSAREILYRRVYAGSPQRREELAQTRREIALGDKVRRVREAAGLTQRELAAKIGTQPSSISRIEDADYDGHSVSLLARVAEALDMRLIIDFERKDHSPERPKAKMK